MDLYTVLELRHDASADEIERSYRRLARRYHPGVNPGDRLAEQLYRQVQSAYRVLGDEEQRRAYDRGSVSEPALAQVEATVSFQGFDFSAPAEGPHAAWKCLRLRGIPGCHTRNRGKKHNCQHQSAGIRSLIS